MKNQNKPKEQSVLLQIIVNFALPIFILNRFSAESSLGPTKSFLLALSFPVILEIHSIIKRRRVSTVSLLAIGGILVTGSISLLGLSEDWLAIRRSIPYFFAGLVILASILLKRPLIDLLLQRVFNMDSITEHARKKKTLVVLEAKLIIVSYFLVGLSFTIAVVSYFLTRIVIDGPANTADFNQDFARLRILSLPIVTLPMFAGLVGIVFYIMRLMEKATGLGTEHLMKKH